MKKTTFKFFKNTPFTNFSNTVLFDSNAQRDEYFSKSFDTLVYMAYSFNFVKDRGIIKVPNEYKDLMGVNYCSFVSDLEPKKVYYAYVLNIKYLNDATTEVTLLIDGIMTECQGKIIEGFKNLTVERKHMKKSEYNRRLGELRCNDDVIKTHTKGYTHEESLLFKDLSVLMQVSADLEEDFGNVDDPKITSSIGLTFDKITSPVNLYVVGKSKFTGLMKKLYKFPWITQNIRSVSLIPTILIEGMTEETSPKSFTSSDLKKLTNGGNTKTNSFDTELKKLSKTNDELCEMFGLDKVDDLHLLRNEYTTTEVYNYNGSSLYIDNGVLSSTYGLSFKSSYVMGFYNEVSIYVQNYKSNAPNMRGSFLNDSITISQFDDVPIMVDNYNLSLSKSANQRTLAESKLVTNRIGSITDSNASLKDRFMNGASLMGSITPSALFGKFQDEYEFYRQQQAEFRDMALDTNSITSQSNNNSLAIARDFFGIHVQHAQPTTDEWNKVKKYYKLFGYMVNDENVSVSPRTMTICDYLKFKGNIQIPNIDIGLLEMIKAQFENGVRFWHYDGSTNPMNQNILLNKMR